jgi:sec-independent protein translocase protein TatA
LSLLFFDFGSGEILLIIIAVFLIFGPSKIPEMARGLGKFINEIKRASEDIKTEINREADRLEREKKLSEYKAQVEKDLDIAEKETTEDIK